MTFDRRILFQADLLLEKGWDVLIVAKHDRGMKVRFTNHHGQSFLLFPSTVLTQLMHVAYNAKIHSAIRPKLKTIAILILKILSKFRLRSIRDGFFKLYFRLASVVNSKISNERLRLVLTKIYRGVAGKRLVVSSEDKSDSTSGFFIKDSLSFADLKYDKCFDSLELDSGIDLVIINDASAAISGIILADRSSSIIWFDAHEFYSEIGSLSSEEKSNYQKIESLVASKATRCYTVNEHLAELMNDDLPTKKFDVLPNAFNPHFINREENLSTTKSIRSELKLSKSATLFVYQGWFGSDRNLEDLIDVFSGKNLEENDFHLALMGYGNLHAVYGKRLPGNVHLVESVESKLIGDRLVDSDCFVIPYSPGDTNVLFCHPNKVGDSIALRIPILFAEGLYHLSEITHHYGFGISAPFASKELTEEIILKTDWRKLASEADWVALDEHYGWTAFQKKFTSWLFEDFGC